MVIYRPLKIEVRFTNILHEPLEENRTPRSVPLRRDVALLPETPPHY